MNVVVPSLYELSPKDISTGAAPQRFVRRLVVATAATVAQFRPLIGIPRDRVCLVQNVSIDTRAGAAQFVTRADVQLEDETNAALCSPWSEWTTGVQLRAFNVQFPDPVIVMPLESLLFEVTYNAGAAVNTTVFNVTGVIVPRGNWQLA